MKVFEGIGCFFERPHVFWWFFYGFYKMEDSPIDLFRVSLDHHLTTKIDPDDLKTPNGLFWCLLMFVDVYWCFLMVFGGFWCFLMFFDGLYIMEDGLEQVSPDHHLTTKIDQKASKKIKEHQKTSTNIKKDQQKRPPKTRRPPSEKTTKDQMTWKHQMVFFDVCWCFFMFVDVFDVFL